MNWFRKFMYGRYGMDLLTILLFIIGLIISIIIRYINIDYLYVLAYIPLVIGIYRTFSKNIFKRQRENNKLLSLFLKVKQKRTRIIDKKHKYFKCTHCNTILRVPRGKGKISITCPKCKKKMIKKT